MSNESVTVQLKQKKDFQFEINFGNSLPTILGDEPPPIGEGKGPSPAQFLAAAVGNCLSDSLFFAIKKYNGNPEPIECDVTATIGRNEQGRLRITHMHAAIQLGAAAEDLSHLERVLTQFEAFCTVTQSVGQGIPIDISITDANGKKLK
ncbi:OsmC family protein [Neopusillimonas maritima]|uniref:Peroxiredoxin n=1 Tax=Neopusillimonas maritima TaxID=2026239 RepID=A0ABX9MZS7_9BURK|nr:OsmC family protein [Neopusillimonas maritima]RII84485.1 peroxiredoxin [Neopusillimonas maritima]